MLLQYYAYGCADRQPAIAACCSKIYRVYTLLAVQLLEPC